MLRKEGTVWLDTARRDVDSESDTGLLFAEPQKVLPACTASEVVPLLESLEK